MIELIETSWELLLKLEWYHLLPLILFYGKPLLTLIIFGLLYLIGGWSFVLIVNIVALIVYIVVEDKRK